MKEESNTNNCEHSFNLIGHYWYQANLYNSFKRNQYKCSKCGEHKEIKEIEENENGNPK